MGPRRIVFIGRLERDTGLLECLKWFGSLSRRYKIDFVGDGFLRKICQRYGRVHGFASPKFFLKKTEICVPGGYLSYIEAKKAGCKIMTFYNNPLKKDYWNEIKKVKKFPRWEEIADEYIDLYNSSK